MRLHDLRPTNPTYRAWYTPRGRRGTAVGRGRRAHLFDIPRGTPPPIGEGARQYWSPYRDYGIHNVQPICGPIQTTVNDYTLGWNNGYHCLNCRNMSEADDRYTIVRADPWTLMDPTARRWTPDPVSGM